MSPKEHGELPWKVKELLAKRLGERKQESTYNPNPCTKQIRNMVNVLIVEE